MAIFGKADADLPLLTRAYQVDTQEVAEIIYLIEQITEGDGGLFWHFLRGEEPETRLKMRQDFAGLCDLTRRVMDDLYTKRLITLSIRRELDPYYRRFPNTLKMTGIEQRGEEVGIPIENLEEGIEAPAHEMPLLTLFSDLKRMLRHLKEGAVRLGKCAECEGIFIEKRTQRAQRQYCSHRCADRVSARRRRQVRRESDSYAAIKA